MKLFFDRYDAGKQLALKLQRYQNTDVVVFALPRGGVLVGYEVAKGLHAPLALAIARKIGHPLQRETGICAITEDGEIVCDELGLCGVDEEWIESESAVQKHEAARQRKAYSLDEGVPSVKNKIAIIVDDGVATGLTLKAAILSVKKLSPEKIIVAVPVSPEQVSREIRADVDDLVVLCDDRHYRGSVGAYYVNFDEIFDAEVIACLKKASSFQKSERATVATVGE